MKRTSVLLAIGSIALLALAGACSDDSTTNPPPATEFVMKDADVANFSSWSRVGNPLKGPDPANLLNGWHGSTDTAMTRTIYLNNASAARGSNGQFPNGTILVKAVRTSSGTITDITGMAKRGGEFNKANNGWEWFTINPTTGAIANRSDTLFSGACGNCHTAAGAGKDYVFTK